MDIRFFNDQKVRFEVKFQHDLITLLAECKYQGIQTDHIESIIKESSNVNDYLNPKFCFVIQNCELVLISRHTRGYKNAPIVRYNNEGNWRYFNVGDELMDKLISTEVELRDIIDAESSREAIVELNLGECTYESKLEKRYKELTKDIKPIHNMDDLREALDRVRADGILEKEDNEGEYGGEDESEGMFTNDEDTWERLRGVSKELNEHYWHNIGSM